MGTPVSFLQLVLASVYQMTSSPVKYYLDGSYCTPSCLQSKQICFRSEWRVRSLTLIQIFIFFALIPRMKWNVSFYDFLIASPCRSHVSPNGFQRVYVKANNPLNAGWKMAALSGFSIAHRCVVLIPLEVELLDQGAISGDGQVHDRLQFLSYLGQNCNEQSLNEKQILLGENNIYDKPYTLQGF